MDVFHRVYLKAAYRSGLVRALGDQRWTALQAIASYMDKEGKCWPTQETLATDLGISVRAVRDRIKSLLAFRFNGEPVLERKMQPGRTHSYSVYRVLPTSQIAIFEGSVSDLATDHVIEMHTPMSSKLEGSGKDAYRTGRELPQPTGSELPINYNQVNKNHLNNNQYNKTDGKALEGDKNAQRAEEAVDQIVRDKAAKA